MHGCQSRVVSSPSLICSSMQCIEKPTWVQVRGWISSVQAVDRVLAKEPASVRHTELELSVMKLREQQLLASTWADCMPWVPV